MLKSFTGIVYFPNLKLFPACFSAEKLESSATKIPFGLVLHVASLYSNKCLFTFKLRLR